MFGLIQNNRVIRRITTAFGSLFTNIVLVRYNNQTGVEQERSIVPVHFGSKEKFIQILDADPLADKEIQISLPIISYTLNGLKYAANRKMMTTGMNFVQTATGASTQYNPVPYDLDFDVNIYVRNIEDGTQIIEQILPYFTPDYSLDVMLIPSMNIKKSIPITLNDTNYEIDNTGDHLGETRKVIWTLNFTAQGWIYGPVTTNANGIITQVIVNFNDINPDTNINLVMGEGYGTYLNSELIYQGSIDAPTAYAMTTNWSANTGRLTITDSVGQFITNKNVTGKNSLATYNLLNYEISPVTVETVIISAVNANIANVDLVIVND